MSRSDGTALGDKQTLHRTLLGMGFDQEEARYFLNLHEPKFKANYVQVAQGVETIDPTLSFTAAAKRRAYAHANEECTPSTS